MPPSIASMMGAAAAGHTEVYVALIGSVGVVLVALIGVWASHRKVGEKIDRIDHSINHVDETPLVGDPHTLGQMVKALVVTVDAGFAATDLQAAANNESHRLMGELLHSHGARLDVIRADLDELKDKESAA